VSVSEEHESSEHLRKALVAMGGRVMEAGLPHFSLSKDGFSLMAVDEKGHALPYERLLSIVAMLEWEDGCQTLAVPYGAPAFLDAVAEKMGGRLIRLGRDGSEARRQLADKPQLRDGLFMAVRLCHVMAATGQTLAALNNSLPPFALSVMEVGLQSDRGAMMRQLVSTIKESELSELVDGLRVQAPGGWVHVSPLPGRRALRIIGEAASEEIAAELCAEMRDRTKKLDNASKNKGSPLYKSINL
jgi:phosphomannomutase